MFSNSLDLPAIPGRHFHGTDIAGRHLRLIGDEQAVSRQILGQLITRAEILEWKAALREIGFIDSQSSSSDISSQPNIAQAIRKSGLDDAQLFAISPRDVCSSLAPKEFMEAGFAQLKRRAEVIVLDTSTLFLFPSELTSYAQDDLPKKLVEDLLDALAEELWVFMDDATRMKRMSFAEVPVQNSKRTGKKGLRPLGKVLESLRRRIAQESIHGDTDLLEEFRKEGPLLFEGETGTGKSEAAAFCSKIEEKKFVSHNYGAFVSEDIAESRVRGIEKGTATGVSQRASMFDEADDGVLFLDEFQNASLSNQIQLLDLLISVSNEVSVARVGKDAEKRQYNVKVVMAVNEPVRKMIEDGRLRRDVYFRIRSIVRFLPTSKILEDRVHGMKYLRRLMYMNRWDSLKIPNSTGDTRSTNIDARSLFVDIDDKQLMKMNEHDWPGNLREIQRFWYDVFYHFDKGLSPDLGISFGAELERTKSRARDLDSEFVETPESSGKSEKLIAVEEAIRRNNYNLGKARRELNEYRLSSHAAFTNYLIANKKLLSSDIAEDSKIRKVIGDARKSYPMSGG